MSVPFAYASIILIWSTTPLAVRWSTEGTGFAFAVLARMLIGVVVATLLLRLGRHPIPLHARARRAYLVGGLGLFGTMALTYWGARHVGSGLISVLFGLSPLVAGVFATRWLLLSAAGLALIFLHDGASAGSNEAAGVCALLGAVLASSASLVGMKRIGDDSPPLATTIGSIIVALPLFALLWLATDGTLPHAMPLRAGGAIAYLGVFGSAVGFALYFYVVRHLEASKVALITLITPVLALMLGHWLNGEVIGPRVAAGTGLILAGLAMHQHTAWRVIQRLRVRA
jgi:drug/metabolite transporter (DMT)-like permease